MGTIQHDTIIVTCFLDHEAESIRQGVIDILSNNEYGFERLVSPVIRGVANGYDSFFIAPDGSKEYWDCSDKANDLRKKVKEYLKRQNADFIHVSYGELGRSIKEGKYE